MINKKNVFLFIDNTISVINGTKKWMSWIILF